MWLIFIATAAIVDIVWISPLIHSDCYLVNSILIINSISMHITITISLIIIIIIIYIIIIIDHYRTDRTFWRCYFFLLPHYLILSQQLYIFTTLLPFVYIFLMDIRLLTSIMGFLDS